MACRSGARSVRTSCPRIASTPRDAGSIIVVLATDAPLLPIQCQRLARRATTGLAWVGGIGANGSGDIFLAFATGNHIRQGEAISDCSHAVARSDDVAVSGGGGGDRGSDPQRADRGGDDDGTARAARCMPCRSTAGRCDATVSAA